MPKKILFINQEITPYVPANAMATMGQEFPQTMQERGYEIRTFMPKWANINERRGQLHEVIRLSGLNIVINDVDHPTLIKVASIPVSRLQVYFIDNDELFTKRGFLADKNGVEYADNGERAIFFARGVIETVRKLRWPPDYIVCQGWMAGLVPFYLRTAYADEPCFADAKLVVTLFEDNIANSLGTNFKSSMVYREASEDLLGKYADDFTLTEVGKLAIDYADAVIQGDGGVKAELLEYATTAAKPLLTIDKATPAACKEFIESL